ncbi:hypothetical protein PRVXT_001827 [Proteinivorax tanatarense]|uniref:Lipoprotein n=1 Tax=Proteinivorax tanatarense TaxID=1260629 RepID=A0AAU7VIF5_9FIRM
MNSIYIKIFIVALFLPLLITGCDLSSIEDYEPEEVLTKVKENMENNNNYQFSVQSSAQDNGAGVNVSLRGVEIFADDMMYLIGEIGSNRVEFYKRDTDRFIKRDASEEWTDIKEYGDKRIISLISGPSHFKTLIDKGEYEIMEDFALVQDEQTLVISGSLKDEYIIEYLETINFLSTDQKEDLSKKDNFIVGVSFYINEQIELQKLEVFVNSESGKKSLLKEIEVLDKNVEIDLDISN